MRDERDLVAAGGASRAPATDDQGAPRATGVVRVIESAKRHPVVVIAATAVAVATFMITTWSLLRDAADVVDKRLNPHQELYAQLEQLKLDVTPEYVDEVLGTPDSVVTPEESCAGCAELSLRIYELDDGVIVRSLFAGSTLSMYLVTRTNAEVKPHIRWQETAYGVLGDVSFAKASQLGDATITPTDVALWPGAQRITYMEIFALGAPGNYEGLILGSTTEGVSDAPLDLGAAQAFADGFESSPPAIPAAAADFRRASRPNTFGVFRDDGEVAALLRDADFVASMQIAGTYT